MLHLNWNRRTFLKASLSAAMLLAGGGGAFARQLVPASLPEGRLSLFNTHNKERLNVTYRTISGGYDPGALAALNRILRCRYTDQPAEMDLRVIEYLNLVDKELGGGNEIHIISGYRSPEYNRLLRSAGHRVAKSSLHLKGRAIDISLPGVKLERVRQTALALRLGGVGYYPRADFVHLDSGAFRTW